MADTMKLLVNTPERVFYNDDVTFVELCTSEGEIGVYPNHVPLTANWASSESSFFWALSSKLLFSASQSVRMSAFILS